LGEWVFRHSPAGSLEKASTEVVADGFCRPNGLVFSPDESILYVTDTGHVTAHGLDPSKPRSIYAFDVIAGGRRLSNRRLIYVSRLGITRKPNPENAGSLASLCLAD
jgi:gluconolactonase